MKIALKALMWLHEGRLRGGRVSKEVPKYD
jgi:hypothetical protein